MRYFLDISYKGTNYSGWQKQQNAPNTVQQELEKALSMILGEETPCTGSGRTDTGVHARQQMVHFDAREGLNQTFLYGLNGILPYDIAVNRLLCAVNPRLRARFDATSRKYEYRIVRRKSPLDWEFAMWIRYPLDVPRMNEASKILTEYRDFGAFCKAHGANLTHICEIKQAFWEEKPNRELLFTIEADRFLRGMVRAIVGTLLLVGAGKISIPEFVSIIESQDRGKAGAAADAKGLSLVEVNYPAGSFEEIA
ncbi:MAG: tRNA pseudouridine(38-40) synthase TruA [Bacteroidia bacterium]|nr:tRNA pseudouridine(38-40) synthase TruA [Bacteroidia bacterium]